MDEAGLHLLITEFEEDEAAADAPAEAAEADATGGHNAGIALPAAAWRSTALGSATSRAARESAMRRSTS